MQDEPEREEWPLHLLASQVTAVPMTLAAVAQPAVCAALAQRFGILSIDRLAADVVLRRLTDGDIAASARIRAGLAQACVVTLEPVAEEIDATVEGRFSERVAEAPAGDHVVDVAPDDDSDEPEPVIDGVLQLGEWLAQQLSLVLDPYPRAGDAAVDQTYASPPDADPPTSQRPFEGLAGLMETKRKK